MKPGRLGAASACGLLLVVGLLALGGACRSRDPAPAGPAQPPQPAGAPATGAAARPEAAPTVPAPPERLVWSGYEPRSLDPATLGDTYGTLLALNLFENLLTYPEGDGPPGPGAAERYDVTPDGLRYTFHLRADGRWSDGRPVTAGDFLYAWRRALLPATGATHSDSLWGIRGARALTEGPAEATAALGLAAPDARTLVVELESPDPLFPLRVASAPFAPAPAWAIEAQGARWTEPGHFVGNGPFVLSGWRPRQDLTLTRNPHFRAADAATLSEIVLRFTTDEKTALRWYEAGEVHWTPGQVPFERIPELRGAGRADLRLSPFACTYFLVFNVRRPPFDDARLRCAFDQALDKERLVGHVLLAGQTPAGQLVPDAYRETCGYVPAAGRPFDRAAARRLLGEAGFPGGQTFPETVLLYNTGEDQSRIMGFVARDLEEGLGVRLQLEHVEWGTHLSRLKAGDFALGRFGLCGAIDPLDLLDVFRTGAANNVAGYSDPTYDRTLEAARREPDPTRRNELLRAAEAQLVRDCVLLPVYFYARAALLSPRVQGYKPHRHDWHQFRTWRMRP